MDEGRGIINSKIMPRAIVVQRMDAEHISMICSTPQKSTENIKKIYTFHQKISNCKFLYHLFLSSKLTLLSMTRVRCIWREKKRKWIKTVIRRFRYTWCSHYTTLKNSKWEIFITNSLFVPLKQFLQCCNKPTVHFRDLHQKKLKVN